MRLYLIYVFSAAPIFLMILFNLGVSAGFASYVPILALLGSTLLFSLAAPLLIFRVFLGSIVGLMSCLCILPFSTMFLVGILEEGIFSGVILLGTLPVILIFVATSLTVNVLIKRMHLLPGIPKNFYVKAALACGPVLVAVLYFFKYFGFDGF
jgi:hypothetical protein